MAQRLGAVFAIAIGSAVFSAHGRLGTPASVTAGFRPAMWACVAFALLATLTSMAIGSHRREHGSARHPAPADGRLDRAGTRAR